jgi:hypothetical protein
MLFAGGGSELIVEERKRSLTWAAKNTFFLTFSKLEEFNRFCAMVDAQKFDATEKNFRLIQAQMNPQTYADKNNPGLYTFELGDSKNSLYFGAELVPSWNPAGNITFDAINGVVSQLKTAFDLLQYCQSSPRNMRDIKKLLEWSKKYNRGHYNNDPYLQQNTWYNFLPRHEIDRTGRKYIGMLFNIF